MTSILPVGRLGDGRAYSRSPVGPRQAGPVVVAPTDYEYGDGDFDFLPSYAHTDELPPVQDTLRTIGTTAFRHSDVGNDVALMHMILVFQWVSELRRDC